MYTTYYDSLAYSTPSTGPDVWSIIAMIIAVVGSILTYFLFVNSKTEAKGKFTKWLKDFLSFKIMWIEPIMKIVYYCTTIFSILYSFTFLQYGGYGVLYFFICLMLVPILIRVGYELFMLFIMVWRNTRDIAENVKKK